MTKKELLALIEALTQRVDGLERDRDRLAARCAELEARLAYTPGVVRPEPTDSYYWTHASPVTVPWGEHERLLTQSLSVHAGIWKALA